MGSSGFGADTREMMEIRDDDEISIRLSRDQALVLFEWLARTSAADLPAAFEDQAEQRAL